MSSSSMFYVQVSRSHIDSIFNYSKDWSTIIKAINHVYFPCGIINYLPLKHKQLRTQEHPLKTSKTGKRSGIQAT